MKKLILLALALILVVALCACNNGEGDGTTTAADSGTKTEAASTTKDTEEDDGTDSAATTTPATTNGTTDPADTTGADTDEPVIGDTTGTDDDETVPAGTTSGEDVGGDDPAGPDRSTWEYSDYEHLYIADVELADGTKYTTQAQKIMPGKSVATKFTVTKGALASVNLGCPSWNDAKGSLTIAIYAWVDGEGDTEQKALKDGYAKTVAADPIYAETFVDFGDNATNSLLLEDYNLPADGGTYLVVVTNPDSEDFEVGYSKSTFIGRDYYTKRGETAKYTLPTDDDIKAAGYDPQFTTDVVSFNTVGAPQYGSYLNLYVDVIFDPAVNPELMPE